MKNLEYHLLLRGCKKNNQTSLTAFWGVDEGPESNFGCCLPSAQSSLIYKYVLGIFS